MKRTIKRLITQYTPDGEPLYLDVEVNDRERIDPNSMQEIWTVRTDWTPSTCEWCEGKGSQPPPCRMHAAAGKMREALKQTLDALYNETHGDDDTPWMCSVKAQARAALAEAEGGKE